LQGIERNVTVSVTVTWNHLQYGKSMNARYHCDYLDRNFECEFYQNHALQRCGQLDHAALVVFTVINFGNQN
jgi:hypothetical protein